MPEKVISALIVPTPRKEVQIKWIAAVLFAFAFVFGLASCGSATASIDPAAVAKECLKNDYLEDVTIDEIMTTLCGEYKTATSEGQDGWCYITFAGETQDEFSVSKGSAVEIRVKCTQFDDGSLGCKLAEATYGSDTSDDADSAFEIYNCMCRNVSGDQTIEDKKIEVVEEPAEQPVADTKAETASDSIPAIPESEYYYLGGEGFDEDLIYYGYEYDSENFQYVKDEDRPSHLILHTDGTFDLKLPYSGNSATQGKWYIDETEGDLDRVAIDLYDKNNRLLISGRFSGEAASLESENGNIYEFISPYEMY